MNVEMIKLSVEYGNRVFWKNVAYEVIKDSIGKWLIYCHLNHSVIGLTSKDGKNLNGNESDFFICNNYKKANLC